MNCSESLTPGGRWRTRAAQPADYETIRALVRELELEYPAMDPARFFVGELDGRIAAVAELKEAAGFGLLSCVGVQEKLQGAGLGRLLVEEVMSHAARDTYLYTLVPGFFRKCGFVEIAAPAPGVPGRWIYGCADCDPSRCLCMVRKINAPGVS